VSNAASEPSENQKSEAARASITLPGTVDKVIPSVYPAEPEKAQIVVEGADHLYREIRVENTLQDKNGHTVALKEGAEVEITIKAEPTETISKSEPS